MTDSENIIPENNIEARDADNFLQYAFAGCLVSGIILMVIGFITVVGLIFKDI